MKDDGRAEKNKYAECETRYYQIEDLKEEEEIEELSDLYDPICFTYFGEVPKGAIMMGEADFNKNSSYCK